ncbi:hypothetical protein L6241_03025 [Janibacter sp. Y6]|uniref:hypothetical protein n=1 Tax=Janibacter sp. Y6 TaxID=2913552 RepID=UPI0034A11DC0
MSAYYRLPREHEEKLRRTRSLVDKLTYAADLRPLEPRFAEELARGQEYLALHATCEEHLSALEAGKEPTQKPRCGRGSGKLPHFRVCRACGETKAAGRFDPEQGICIACKYKKEDARLRQTGTEDLAGTALTRSRACPVCLVRVAVDLEEDGWTVQPHSKRRGDEDVECDGSGRVLYRSREDAMDRRVPGSFEHGKRR